MFRVVFMLVLFGSLFLFACQTANPTEEQREKVEVPGGSYTDVSLAELQSMLKNKDFTFVNVHIPFAGDIPGTDLSITYNTYNEIDQQLNQLPADKNAKIVLYCRSDRMSTIASKTLVGLGYTSICNLKGGMVAREQAGFELNFK